MRYFQRFQQFDVNIFLKKGYFYEYDNIALLKNDIHIFTSFKFVRNYIFLTFNPVFLRHRNLTKTFS